MMLRAASIHSSHGGLPGILAITATYVYFLLYAQFVFLRHLELHLEGPQIQQAMASMGLTGLAVSLLTGWLLGRQDPRRLLAVGFAGAAASTLLALGATSIQTLLVVAALVGASTAVVTVTLAANLRTFIVGPRFGLKVGLGTGLAYLFCNLPPIFESSTAVGSAAAIAACLIGLGAVRWLGHGESTSSVGRALRRQDFYGWGFFSAILGFLALIWLDSAAFAIIQDTAVLKDETWGSAEQKLGLGVVHLLAALLAGWLIDREGRPIPVVRSLLCIAFALFTTAFLLLDQGSEFLALVGPIYATGISLYSVALVTYPSYRGDEPGLVPRRFRAAILYGVAGWIGSALGVGMAQNLHAIPHLFLWAAGSVLLTGLALVQGGGIERLTRSHAVTLLAGAVAMTVYTLEPPTAAIDVETPHEATGRGRRVYIQEGCIHCHSQYIRPRSHDVELWGPRRALDPAEKPPLYGNRRQGPDLSNVGNRRSETWHRLHLLDPQSVMPTSRMPSYAHLFDDDNQRGEDLVAYLSSLGAETREEWFEFTREVTIEPQRASSIHGRSLFRSYCAPCHGAGGRGDGPLAEAIYRPAMNLQKETYWLVDWGPGAEPLETALARLIKYGMPGTSMPGHETLTDQDLADLVAFLESRHYSDGIAGF